MNRITESTLYIYIYNYIAVKLLNEGTQTTVTGRSSLINTFVNSRSALSVAGKHSAFRLAEPAPVLDLQRTALIVALVGLIRQQGLLLTVVMLLLLLFLLRVGYYSIVL